MRDNMQRIVYFANELQEVNPMSDLKFYMYAYTYI